MNLALTVAEIVAPVFLLAAVGFAWCRAGVAYPTDFVTRLAMTLAVPCLIFTALMQAEVAPAALARLAGATLAAYGAVLALAWAGCRAAGLDVRAYAAALTFGNTGNLGLPLALFAFGAEGLGYAIVVFAAMCIVMFTLGIALVAGDLSPRRLAAEPIIWASLLGALFLWQGWRTPPVLTSALELMGQMAIPLMLVTLGVAVARLPPYGLVRAAALSVAKVVASVAVAVGTAAVFGVDGVARDVLILQLATPVGVSLYLIAERFGTRPLDVAGLVVVSTALSVVALPAILAALL